MLTIKSMRNVKNFLLDESGMGVVEILLITVVLIAMLTDIDALVRSNEFTVQNDVKHELQIEFGEIEGQPDLLLREVFRTVLPLRLYNPAFPV